MPRIFKKAQSGVQQETAKSNMLKRFGGKFKKAFSKTKQVCSYSALLEFAKSLTEFARLSSLTLKERMNLTFR